jgi:hypothetical protein
MGHTFWWGNVFHPQKSSNTTNLLTGPSVKCFCQSHHLIPWMTSDWLNITTHIPHGFEQYKLIGITNSLSTPYNSSPVTYISVLNSHHHIITSSSCDLRTEMHMTGEQLYTVKRLLVIPTNVYYSGIILVPPLASYPYYKCCLLVKTRCLINTNLLARQPYSLNMPCNIFLLIIWETTGPTNTRQTIQ